MAKTIPKCRKLKSTSISVILSYAKNLLSGIIRKQILRPKGGLSMNSIRIETSNMSSGAMRRICLCGAGKQILHGVYPRAQRRVQDDSLINGELTQFMVRAQYRQRRYRQLRMTDFLIFRVPSNSQHSLNQKTETFFAEQSMSAQEEVSILKDRRCAAMTSNDLATLESLWPIR